MLREKQTAGRRSERSRRAPEAPPQSHAVAGRVRLQGQEAPSKRGSAPAGKSGRPTAPDLRPSSREGSSGGDEAGAANFEPLVLIVDDDGDTRRSIRDVLVAEGYVAEGVANGRDALERLSRRPLPRARLLDLMMPVMNGHTLLGEIEARPDLAALPIVVLTASSVDEASSTLNVPLLRKPIGIEALLTIVEHYAPRFWDDEEPLTEEVSISGDSPTPGVGTTK